MSNNTLGKIFSVHSFGESHGKAVGCVVDGVPAGLKIDLQKIQEAVNYRKTGQNSMSSSRSEEDIVEIISGLKGDTSLGSPITILIKNADARPKDYDELQNVFRPNHADYTNFMKYGIRDANGGGRTSIRITAPLVAAGALAEQYLAMVTNIKILSYVAAIGPIENNISLDAGKITQDSIYQHPFRLLGDNEDIFTLLDDAKMNGDTLGGVIATQVFNCTIGLGEPIFNKLHAALGHAMLSINTVKGFEYGSGFESAKQFGSEHNDSFIANELNEISLATNHSGGIQGGISNGMTLDFRVALKPISSIQKVQQTVNEKGNNIALEIKGRHDICAVPRAVPIVRAYTAIILADFLLQQKLNKI
jgi:chorismate synthase